MLSSAPRQTGQPHSRPPVRIATICIVDPQPDDYQGWDSLAEANGVRVRMVASAEEALRVAHTAAVDLWVVNVELPGLSGCELCGMLRARSTPAPVYLVANEYSPAAERAALRSQATLFGCKPGHENWLGEWLEQTSRRLAKQPTVAASDPAPATTPAQVAS